MSRIGNAPVEVPGNVTVEFDGQKATVTGPKGTLERVFTDKVTFELADGVINVARVDEERESKALHGLSRMLLHNMVVGVSEGYRREMQTVGVGYRASLSGSTLELLVGFSHPVHVKAPDGIEFEVPEPTQIIVSGIDKELVGQTAANIRAVRPPEPYKGKGIRYTDEHVRRKAGKSGVAR